MDQSNAAYFSQEQQVVEKDKQYKMHKERDWCPRKAAENNLNS